MEKTLSVCQAEIVLNWKSEIVAFVVIWTCVFRDEKQQTELVEVINSSVFLCAPKYLGEIGLKQTMEYLGIENVLEVQWWKSQLLLERTEDCKN